MALNSINFNAGAAIALANLASTQNELGVVQNRISTGLKIDSPKANGAIWAIAQTEKAQSSSLEAVQNSLSNATSVLDTTLGAGDQLINILNQARQKALAASDPSIDDASRAQYASEFAKLGQSYANTIASASFNGVNLVDGGTGKVQALGSADATITVSSNHAKIDFNTLFGAAKATTTTAGALPGGAPANAPFTADSVALTANAWTGATGAADAGSDLALVDTAIKKVTQTLSGFGVDAKAIENQRTLVQGLQTSLDNGVSNLVDANLAQESAKLQALQTKQQLGIQALSIANASSSSLLNLFR